MIGQILANRYQILAKVGEGGMAQVYEARDNLLFRPVAIKVLREQYANASDGKPKRLPAYPIPM